MRSASTPPVQFHEAFDREPAPTPVSPRAFGLLAATLLTVIALRPLLRHGHPVSGALWAASLLGLVGGLAPRLLSPFAAAWTWLGRRLGGLVNPLLMAVVFFGVVTPMGWLMRRFTRDPLRLAWNPSADSYWLPRVPPGPAPESLTHQF